MDPPQGRQLRKHTLASLQHPDPTPENFARIARQIDEKLRMKEAAERDRDRYTAGSDNRRAALERIAEASAAISVLRESEERMRRAAGVRAPRNRAPSPSPPRGGRGAPPRLAAPASEQPLGSASLDLSDGEEEGGDVARDTAGARDEDSAGYLSDAAPRLLGALSSVKGVLQSGLGKVGAQVSEWRRRRELRRQAEAEAAQVLAESEARALEEQTRRDLQRRREERLLEREEEARGSQEASREAERAAAESRKAVEELKRLREREAAEQQERTRQAEAEAAAKAKTRTRVPLLPDSSSSSSDEEPLTRPRPLAAAKPLPHLPSPPPPPEPSPSALAQAAQLSQANQSLLSDFQQRAESLVRKLQAAGQQQQSAKPPAAPAPFVPPPARPVSVALPPPQAAPAPLPHTPDAPVDAVDALAYKIVKERTEPRAPAAAAPAAKAKGSELKRPGKGPRGMALEDALDRSKLKDSDVFIYNADPHMEDRHPKFDENYMLAQRQSDERTMTPLPSVPDPRPPIPDEAKKLNSRGKRPLEEYEPMEATNEPPPTVIPRLQLPATPDSPSSSAPPSSRSSSSSSSPFSSRSSSVASTPRLVTLPVIPDQPYVLKRPTLPEPMASITEPPSPPPAPPSPPPPPKKRGRPPKTPRPAAAAAPAPVAPKPLIRSWVPPYSELVRSPPPISHDEFLRRAWERRTGNNSALPAEPPSAMVVVPTVAAPPAPPPPAAVAAPVPVSVSYAPIQQQRSYASEWVEPSPPPVIDPRRPRVVTTTTTTSYL